jgi:hypothetical protein
MTGPIYVVADLDRPNPEPFAVIAVYPDRPKDGGCEGVCVSLHMTRDEAERVVRAGNSLTETSQ